VNDIIVRSDEGFQLSENEQNIFSEAGGFGDAAGSLPHDPTSDPSLVLRAHAESGDFLTSITCVPAQVTVLLTSENEEIEAFRQNLLGTEKNERIAMRLGERVLNSSEIFIAGNADFVWRSSSLDTVLRTSGYSENAARALATRLNLSEKLSSAPGDLSREEIRRLVVACAFRAKSRVVLFDKPFADLDATASNFLAEFMLEGATLGGRIVLVSGVDKVPAPWQAAERVAIEGETPDLLKRTTSILRKDSLVGNQIRSLRREPSSIRERDSFVTRPQRISFGHQSNQAALTVEAIANPHVPQEKSETLVNYEASAELDTEGSCRRSPSGKLTRVTGSVRLRHSRAYLFYRHMRRRIRRAMFPRDVAHATPLERKVHWLRRGEELKVFLLVVLLLLGALLVLLRFTS